MQTYITTHTYVGIYTYARTTFSACCECFFLRLCLRVCQSVGRSVRPSVCPSHCLSIHRCVRVSILWSSFQFFQLFLPVFFFARIFPGNGNMCWWKIHAVKMTVTQHTAYRTPATIHNTLRRTQRARLHEHKKKTHSLSHIENVSEMLLTCIQTKCQIMPTTIMKFLDLTIHGPGTMGEQQPYTDVSSTNHWMNASYWIQDNFWWKL